MRKKPTGGPAHPTTTKNEMRLNGQEGMTLRDYFAGQALIGGMISCAYVEGPLEIEMLSNECYQVADAMLKAREG